MTLPADLKARVLAAARERPSTTRRAGRTMTALLLGTAASALVAVFLAYGGVHGNKSPSPAPDAFMIGTGVGWLVVAALATWGAFRRTKMGGRPRAWLVGVALATPVALFAWTLAWNVLYPETFTPQAGRIGVKCLELALLMGAWPLLALLIARRGSDPFHPGATGAAYGAAAGAWAGVALDLWCPIANPAHIALGHILPLVIFVVMGAVLGRRIVGVRR